DLAKRKNVVKLPNLDGTFQEKRGRWKVRQDQRSHAISVKEAVVSELHVNVFGGVEGDVAARLKEVHASVSIPFPEALVGNDPVLRLVLVNVRGQSCLVVGEVRVEPTLVIYHPSNLNAAGIVEYGFVKFGGRA